MSEREDLMAELIRLEQARRDGWLDRDREALRAMMAEDFTEVNVFGRLRREDLLDGLFPELVLKRFDMDGFRLTRAAEGAAVLTYHCFERLSYQGGEDLTGEFHVSATYAQRDERWLLLHWQITPYEGG